MSLVYLNGEYLPMEQASISPMDRGFLFGDGVYEVIPVYNGRMVGFDLHIQRMQRGLDALEIKSGVSAKRWLEICNKLYEANVEDNLAVYLQVTRGADSKRFHAYPSKGIAPTIFACASEISQLKKGDKKVEKGVSVSTATDMRWKRCNIKSIALLGNVMHFQQGYKLGCQETLLFNEKGELTEGSASNVFIVNEKIIATPVADSQILPGVTRYILLESLRQNNSMCVQERVITKQEVLNSDEIWITSSSKGVIAVVEVDQKPVANGKVGDYWEVAQQLYLKNKFKF